MWKGPLETQIRKRKEIQGATDFIMGSMKSNPQLPFQKKYIYPQLGNQFFLLSHALGGKCVSLFGQNQDNQYPLYVGNGLPTVNM